MDTLTTPHVYTAICGVMADLASAGIGKDRKNAQQGFAFRGIDDVHNALAPVLVRHKLCMLPRVVSREATERQTKSGSAMFCVSLAVEFDLVSSVDGSRHVVAVSGEAMDSADKATNKAMSAAYKYAAIQAFCIPVEGTPDADAETPEPVRQKGREHHESWERDRAAFCAALGKMGGDFGYEHVADFCAAIHRPRPSAMDGKQRVALMTYLTSDRGRSDYLAWLNEGTIPTKHAAQPAK